MMSRLLSLIALGVALVPMASPVTAQTSAASAFDRLRALEGEWVDAEGTFGKKGAVAVTYRVTAGGNAVIETFPVGTSEEMVTVYHKDGDDIVLTHYCSGGNQPRMRARAITGNVLAFEFAGGANIDLAVTSHMHSAQIEFVSADEISATWNNWSMGKPDDEHRAMFRVVRKKP